MRTAQILKLFAYGIIIIIAFFAFKLFGFISIEFWMAILLGFLLWIILRLFAILGQLIFEIRNDSLRILMNIERALYYSNSLTKEIRDLMESGGVGKEVNENSPR